MIRRIPTLQQPWFWIAAFIVVTVACASSPAAPHGGGAAGTGGVSAAGGSAGANTAGQGGTTDGGSQGSLVTKISNLGITWNFKSPVRAGQFITGDWWVVGPVTVQSVEPAPTAGRNGSQVDPVGGSQAYDDRGGQYNASLAATFPLTLQGPNSLVSSESKPASATIKNYGNLVTQAVLTVLPNAPPADAFRPTYAKSTKTIYRWSQVDLSKLLTLSSPDPSMDSAKVLAMLSHGPHVDHLGTWEFQHSCAAKNWGDYTADAPYGGCYGRDYCTLISQAAVMTLLDVPQRQGIVRGLIEIGIDNYGALLAGTQWTANGGHMSGRKFPILFAGALLGDTNLANVGVNHPDPNNFGEDSQTYYGTNGKALFGIVANPEYFLAGCSGPGSKDARDPAGLVDGCPDYRNCCTSSSWVGEALAARKLGLIQGWHYNAFFDYVDRWMNGDVVGGGSATTTLVTDMWKAYR